MTAVWTGRGLRVSGAVVAAATLAVISACAVPVGNSLAGAPSVSTQAVSAASIRRPAHVVVVVLENHAESRIIGNAAAPYLNSLATHGALMLRSYAVTHPSQPNYLALFSGSTHGVGSDSCPHTFRSRNLGSVLRARGHTFVGYSEGLPRAGYTGCSNGYYVRKHAPWVNFSNLPTHTSKPMSAFPTDFAALPTVSFVIPDLRHDMHDGTIGQGDRWVQRHLGAYVTWARSHHSLLVVTFDEDDHSARNHIATIVVGAGVRRGRYYQHITHYSVLRTIEDMYGLPLLGASATAKPISGIWS